MRSTVLGRNSLSFVFLLLFNRSILQKSNTRHAASAAIAETCLLLNKYYRNKLS